MYDFYIRFLVRALFDTIAIRSFISKEVVDRVGLNVTYLVTSLRVVNHIGRHATLRLRYTNLELIPDDHLFLCDSFVFDFKEYGVILCMDWLVPNETKIYCADIIALQNQKEETSLSVLGRDEREIWGFVVCLRKSRRGGQSFCSSRVYICFKPMTGLPLRRTIKFRIDLVPEAWSVSMPPS